MSTTAKDIVAPDDLAILDQAADELKRFVVRIQAIMLLPPVIERIGSLTRATVLAQKRADEAEAKAASADARIATANAAVEAANTDAGRILETANARASEIIAHAMAEAVTAAEFAAADLTAQIAAKKDELTALSARADQARALLGSK